MRGSCCVRRSARTRPRALTARLLYTTGEKVIAIIDNNSYVLAPLPVAPADEADTVLLPEGLKGLKRMAKLTGLVLEGSYLNLAVHAESVSHHPHWLSFLCTGL
jgi:hypothetical protein